jgi:hypothetical protein
MAKHLKVIIDYDGTLTAEETQVAALAKEVLGAPREALSQAK